MGKSLVTCPRSHSVTVAELVPQTGDPGAGSMLSQTEDGATHVAGHGRAGISTPKSQPLTLHRRDCQSAEVRSENPASGSDC